MSTWRTFNLKESGEDGHVEASGASYPPGGAPVASITAETFYLARKTDDTFDTGFFYVVNGLLYWDTSEIPDDATVLAATLLVYIVGAASNDIRNLVLEWYSNPPITTADYTATAPASPLAYNQLIADLEPGTTNTLTLTNAAANVNKSGYTGLRGHVSGGQPGSFNANEVGIVALDSDEQLPEAVLMVESSDEERVETTERTGRRTR